MVVPYNYYLKSGDLIKCDHMHDASWPDDECHVIIFDETMIALVLTCLYVGEMEKINGPYSSWFNETWIDGNWYMLLTPQGIGWSHEDTLRKCIFN